MAMTHERPGFTLIELAIVLVIMGIIAGVMIPTVITGIKKDKISTARESLSSLRQKIVGYATINKKLPPATDLMFSVKDAWGNTPTYTPNAGLLAPAGNDLCLLSSPGSTLTVGTTNDVAFFIRSPGPDSLQDINAAGPAIDVTNPGDDIFEFMTFYQLYRIVCPPAGARNTTSSVGTLDQFATSTPVTSSNGMGATILPDGSILLGLTDAQQSSHTDTGTTNYTSGCIWNSGTAGGCTRGNCTMQNGMRAYFVFNMTRPAGYSGALADGFTFTVASATTNGFHVCGGKGSAMGYASGYWNYPNDAGNAPFLLSPKIGVEFDNYRCYGDNGVTGGCGSGCGLGGSYDHVALLYWGTEDTTGINGTPEGRRSKDDNTHNSGSPADAAIPQNPVCEMAPDTDTDGFRNLGSATWFLDRLGVSVPVRVDIRRTNSLSATQGTYKTQVWVNCQNCNDVTSNATTFTSTAKLSNSTTFSSTLTSQFQNVILGFTQGTGGSRQQVIIKSLNYYFY